MVAALGLVEHPEGGWYRRTWASPEMLTTPRGPRHAVTSIQYLLDAQTSSAWHRVNGSRELWLWQGGGRLRLTTAGSAQRPGKEEHIILGPPEQGPSQHFVEPGHWQRAETLDGTWTFCACVVCPGFDFADFEQL